MAPSFPASRLTDIVEAIELIRDEMTGVTLAALSTTGASVGWWNVALKSSPKPAGA
jgi:hypothetical protein